MPDDRLKIGAAGFDGYQRKPIRVRDFIALVRRMIASQAGKETTEA
jgi:CheY-like chemotaxis protein